MTKAAEGGCTCGPGQPGTGDLRVELGSVPKVTRTGALWTGVVKGRGSCGRKLEGKPQGRYGLVQLLRQIPAGGSGAQMAAGGSGQGGA